MLQFYHRGQGDVPVVLLHGFLGSGRNLMSLARAWSERDPSLRLLVPDLLGHGESPALPEQPDLEDLARSVLDLADAEADTRPITLVGHSLGGRTALQATLMEPTRIRKVVLLDIGPSPITARSGPGDLVEILRSAPDRAASRGDMGRHFARHGVSGPLTDWLLMNLVRGEDDYRWRVDRDRLARLHTRTVKQDLWPAVERPDSPVRHCIRGGESPFVSDAEAERLQAAGCRVSTVPGAGHFVHVDALPDLVDCLVQHP